MHATANKPTRRHRMRRRAAVVTAAAALATAAGTVPAFAAEHSTVAGCFTADWNPGWLTTTVYYHNHCSTTHQIQIAWNGSYKPSIVNVPGGGKGARYTTSNGVQGVYDNGRV